MGDIESMYTELALYGSKIECARTDNVFFPISEVCDGTVSLISINIIAVIINIIIINIVITAITIIFNRIIKVSRDTW